MVIVMPGIWIVVPVAAIPMPWVCMAFWIKPPPAEAASWVVGIMPAPLIKGETLPIWPVPMGDIPIAPGIAGARGVVLAMPKGVVPAMPKGACPAMPRAGC